VKQHSIAYGSERIAFVLRIQPERKSSRISIHVEPDGQVLVDAPQDAPLSQVRAAVGKRARWISSHVRAATGLQATMLPREYVSGESALYLGRRYRLKVLVVPDAAPAAALRGAFIEVSVPAKDRLAVRATLEAWYRERARTVFQQRLAAIGPSLLPKNVGPPMRLQSMSRQWGSCSPTGRLTLNPFLVKAPRECIDYVLVHELCHLKQHNHSRNFYNLLDRHMPGWREVKQRLDALAGQIFSR